MTGTRIVAVEVRPFDVPLHEPFGVATGAQDVARNVLATVTLDDGTTGYGEAAPFPAINGETQEHAVASLLASRAAVIGEDAAAWRKIAERIRARTEPGSSARCALETAVLDAFTRSRGVSLVDFFGGACRELFTDMTITTGSVKDADKAVKAVRARGMRAIKLKIGSQDLDLEVERVAKVRAVAKDDPLILDGNCAYDARTAIRLLEALAKRGFRVDLFEQPVAKHDLDGLKEVAHASDVPVAADESVQDAKDAQSVIRKGAAQVINVKLMKCGIAEALDIVAVARASGTGLMIGGMIETRLAMSASACFAAGQGGFDFVDLDTPLFLAADPFSGGYAQEGDRLDLSPIVRGHGVDPRPEFFGRGDSLPPPA